MTRLLEKPSAPLRVRLRADLVIVPIRSGRGRFWHVKDPVSLRFFQLDEREFGVLQLLDGVATIDQILHRFSKRFAPLHLSAQQLLAFVDEARRNGLLIIDRPADRSLQSVEGEHRGRWTRLLSRLNPLAIQLPWVNPDGFLKATYPLVRWMFTPAFVSACVGLIVLALGTAVLGIDRLADEMPTSRAFFSPEGLMWLAIAIAATKVIHELAHACTCKHFGGECHELGILLLVFVPCLYCNVSDSWLMSRRRERMLITAAGILTELFLAAVATFVWWFAVEGPVRSCALAVMVVCSLNTLLLNGNPLMRYDGYYLLSDFVNVPNLASEASRVLNLLWRRWALGLTSAAPRRDYPNTFLAIYGITSFGYRLIVFSAILLVIHSLAREFRLQILAWMLTAATLTSLLLPMILAAGQLLLSARQRRRMKPAHLMVTVLAISLLAGIVWALPLPFHIEAPLLVEPGAAENIVVTTPGILEFAAAEGTAVQPGDLVARLRNPELSRQRDQLQAQSHLLTRKLEVLMSARGTSEEAAAGIPATRKAIEDVSERLRALDENLARLELRAGRPGIVARPRNVPTRGGDREQARSWSGSPLDPSNLGCYLEPGTMLCLISAPSDRVATLYLDQQDVPFTREGQSAELLVTGMQDRTLYGRVARISPVPVDEVPRELAARSLVPIDRSNTSARPLVPLYQVRVELDEPEFDPSLLPRWSTGKGRIALAPQPLGDRLWRAVRNTFHFEL